MIRALVLAGLVALLALPGPAGGQEGASLERVEELTRLGRTEEARVVLMEWWDRGRSEASRRDLQRGLWLRGRLTVDPSQAALDFRRLVVEYPGGAFSDRALLRLAQAAWATGDADGVEAHLAQLARDYPDSPVARQARAWRSDAGPVPDPPRGAGEGTTGGGEAGAGAGDPDPDASGGPGAPAADAGGPGPTEDTVADAEGAGRFAVQLGAFAGQGRARALRDRVAASGYEVRLVRVEGSELTHVRVGRFPRMEEAEKLLEEVRALGLTAALVRDAHRERQEPR